MAISKEEELLTGVDELLDDLGGRARQCVCIGGDEPVIPEVIETIEALLAKIKFYEGDWITISFTLDEWRIIMLCIEDGLDESDPTNARWGGPMLEKIRDTIKLRLEKEKDEQHKCEGH